MGSTLSRVMKLLLGPERYSLWQNRRQWESRSDDYRTSPMTPPWQTLYGEVADLCLSHAEHTIHEYGCGYGYLLKQIHDLGFGGELQGTDFSTAQIDQAHGYFPQGAFRQADLLELPFADGYFDVAVGVGVLMYLPPNALARALRELKRTSKIVISVENHLRYFNQHQAERYAASKDGRFSHDYEKCFNEAGFDVLETRRVESFWDHKINPDESLGMGLIVARAAP